jgi:D-hexose-6-phosphate mutarotase
MPDARIERLNRRFGRGAGIRFSEGIGGLPKADLVCNEASAEVFLQGAHISRYRPRPGIDALWLSESAIFQPGKALRGGIPLCWPWFGAATERADRPQHGYARNADFCVISTTCEDDVTAIVLALDPAQATFAEWQNKLQLELEIRLAESLWMEMRSRNLSAEPLILGNALHSYFAIADRGSVSIPALTGLYYRDKPQDYRQRQQSSAIEFDAEVDRVYRDPPATLELIDHARRLVTTIQSWGNNNLVVWNPGAEKARAMADFDDAGYRRMLCIEPANALQQCVTLQPGECQRLGQRITVAAIATT